ncbi:MAG: hypothetical protein M3296_06350 [Actinomycetota bacterium]|nr:hypothetical protein [Actinomycetota bacterium]
MGVKGLWKRFVPVKHDLTAHTRGVSQGNSTGNYEREGGHLADGRSTAQRSTGIAPESHNPIHPDMPNLSPP